MKRRAILGLWAGLALLFTTHTMLPSPAIGRPSEWWSTVLWYLAGSAPWIGAGPLVFRLARRWLTLARPALLGRHVAAALLLAVVCAGLGGAVRWLAYAGARTQLSLGRSFSIAVIDEWAFHSLVYWVVLGLYYALHAARLEAALAGWTMPEQQRRDQGPDPPDAATFRFGDVVVDMARRTVLRAGRPVALRPKEFDLLCALRERNGAIVSRDELLREVWGYADRVMSRTVDTHVGTLRRALEENPAEPRHILTVRQAGYRLEPHPSLGRGPASVKG